MAKDLYALVDNIIPVIDFDTTLSPCRRNDMPSTGPVIESGCAEHV